jgi:hypothetical protein
MAIYRLLQNSPLGPEEIKRMTDAYEMALRVLQVNRGDLITETIAMKIIAVTQTGERDTSKICARALKELGMVPLKDVP